MKCTARLLAILLVYILLLPLGCAKDTKTRIFDPVIATKVEGIHIYIFTDNLFMEQEIFSYFDPIVVDIYPVYFYGLEFWPLDIVVDSEKAKDGTWVGADLWYLRVADGWFGSKTEKRYDNVIIYVRTPEQKKQWEDCIREIAFKHYKPRDVVPCQ